MIGFTTWLASADRWKEKVVTCLRGTGTCRKCHKKVSLDNFERMLYMVPVHFQSQI